MENNLSTVITRIFDFIEKEGISIREFSEKVGISHSLLRKITAIGSDKLEKIFSAYPNLNIVWVMTGEGCMYNTDKNVSPICKPNLLAPKVDYVSPKVSPVPQNDFNPSDPKWNADFSDTSDNDECLHCIEKERIIEALMAVIASKQDVIRAKEDIIHCKDDLINELSRKSKNATESPE